MAINVRNFINNIHIPPALNHAVTRWQPWAFWLESELETSRGRTATSWRMRQADRGHTRTMAMRASPNQAQEKVDGLNGSAAEPVAAARTPFSPLLSLLTCENTVPSLLECEKAVIVTKEHDYDRVPERCELMQLTPTILRMATETEAARAMREMDSLVAGTSNESEPRKKSQRKQTKCAPSLKNALLDCQQMLLSTRQKLLQPSEDCLSAHLRRMVGFQASLIHELQEQLHVRDVELVSVRREKDQVSKYR